MTLQNRLSKLERKYFHTGLVFIILKQGETEKRALERCYPAAKPKQVVFLDEYDTGA